MVSGRGKCCRKGCSFAQLALAFNSCGNQSDGKQSPFMFISVTFPWPTAGSGVLVAITVYHLSPRESSVSPGQDRLLLMAETSANARKENGC